MPSMKAQMLRARLESDPSIVVVDVRDAAEFARATVPGAINEPLDEHTATRIAHSVGDRRRPIVFVCSWGHRSAVATISMRREGFRDVSYLEGGLEAWGFAALPVTPGNPNAQFDLEPERLRIGD